MWVCDPKCYIKNMCACSVVSHCLQTPWTVAYPAPLNLEFSRQEYWSGLPFPLRDLSDPGFEPTSPALQEESLTPSCLGSPHKEYTSSCFSERGHLGILTDSPTKND